MYKMEDKEFYTKSDNWNKSEDMRKMSVYLACIQCVVVELLKLDIIT